MDEKTILTLREEEKRGREAKAAKPFLERFFKSCDREIGERLRMAVSENELRIVQAMAVYKTNLGKAMESEIKKGDSAANTLIKIGDTDE